MSAGQCLDKVAPPPCLLPSPLRQPSCCSPAHNELSLNPLASGAPAPPPLLLQLRFNQDNTITDRPMVDVMVSLDHMLESASARAGSSSIFGSALHQLVLIIADGRFHEKDSLRRAVREAAGRPGVLYAFIVLDNAANSILDMQTVRFVGGQPVFDRYLDSFPFPYYIVLRDTAALPRTLADLLRQWFELSAHG